MIRRKNLGLAGRLALVTGMAIAGANVYGQGPNPLATAVRNFQIATDPKISRYDAATMISLNN